MQHQSYLLVINDLFHTVLPRSIRPLSLHECFLEVAVVTVIVRLSSLHPICFYFLFENSFPLMRNI